jgi:hypothetical protein
MLSAWTLGGHLLLRSVDDSSGEPAASDGGGISPRRNLTACGAVSITTNIKFLCGSAIENILKNNVLHIFVNVMVHCRALELGSHWQHWKG